MKICAFNYNNILSDIIDHLFKGNEKDMEIVDDFIEADKILIWNEVMPDTIKLIESVGRFNLPIITVQHGRHGSSRYYPPFNNKIISDKYCAWGDRDRRNLIEAGNDPKKIVVTGTTIFSHLKPRVPHEGTNIVFSPEHWDTEVPENKGVADELRRIAKKHGFNIITKIINGHDPELYDNVVYSNRQDRTHFDIVADVLSKADLVVGLLEGTFELLAQSLDIPIVSYAKWEPKAIGGDTRYMEYRRETSTGADQVFDIRDLEEAILRQLEMPELLQSVRRDVCIDEGGINIKNPLQEIIKVIRKA